MKNQINTKLKGWNIRIQCLNPQLSSVTWLTVRGHQTLSPRVLRGRLRSHLPLSKLFICYLPPSVSLSVCRITHWYINNSPLAPWKWNDALRLLGWVECDARLITVTAVHLSVSVEAETAASRCHGYWLIELVCGLVFGLYVLLCLCLFYTCHIAVEQTVLFADHFPIMYSCMWYLATSSGNQHFLIIMQIGC